MTTKPEPTKPRDAKERESEEPLPSLSEQVSQQLGGARGLIESSVPVLAFVVLQFVGSKFDLWTLKASLFASVGFALAIAAFRLLRKQPIRHALNGVFGIVIGAAIAMRSGEARDFHLPSIFISAGYGTALAASVAFRRPLVGWLWSVMLDGGGTRWFRHGGLLRLFSKLTGLWVLMYGIKVAVGAWLYHANESDWLGVFRIVFGWPPYALLLALTVWSARRLLEREGEPPPGSAGTAKASPAALPVGVAVLPEPDGEG